MLDFPGFGRIIERSEEADEADEAEKEEAAKQLDSPTVLRLTGELDALSTGRDLSGRCLSDDTHISPDKVSPDEAQLICQSVLSEILAETAVPVPKETKPSGKVATPRGATVETPRGPDDDVDLARVKVLVCDRGCISGMLEWSGKERAGKPEKVAFTLVEIRQGYTVVGETVEGPKLLSSCCWKLQSVNGSADARPAWIRRGDELVLEGPKWATKRLVQPLPPQLKGIFASPPTKLPKEDPIGALPLSCRSRSASSAPLPEEPSVPPLLSASTPPQTMKPSCTDRSPPQAIVIRSSGSRPHQRPVPQEAHISRSIDFEVVHVSSAAPSSPHTSMPSALEPQEEKVAREPNETTTFSEVSSASSSQDRPVVPVLDLTVVDRRRKAMLQKIGNGRQPESISEHPHGCDFGWVECSMLPPAAACSTGAKKAQGKREKDSSWKCI